MSEAARYQLFTAATPTVTRIIPELAKEIGLNESIMLLQLDFWINHTKNLEGGKWWTYQSVRDMQEKAFPYWSLMTINRTVKSLEKKGFVTVGNFNSRKSDNTRWITLNYKVLETLKSVRVGRVNNEDVSESDTPYQNDTPAYQNDTATQQNDTTLPETPKDNQKKKKSPAPLPPHLVALQNSLNTHLFPYLEAWQHAAAVNGEPPPISSSQRGKMLEDAQTLLDRGCTADDWGKYIAERKKARKSTVWTFSFSEVHEYLGRTKLTVVPKAPPTPEQEASYQAILEEARAEREAAYRESKSCPAS